MPLRFGDGALSVFTSFEFSGGGKGTDFYPGRVDGMSDFRSDFTPSVAGGLHGFGLKLVTPFPSIPR